MLLVQPITVRHFSDPGCPWAYSASPALATLRWRYGAQLDWKLTLIGLTERAQQYVDRGYTPQRQARGYRNFRQYGMPFQTQPKHHVAATSRACRAVVAARMEDPALGDAAFRALQLMQFTTPLVLDEDGDLATGLRRVPGLDAQAIVARIDDPDVVEAYEADRARARTAAGSPTEFQGKSARHRRPRPLHRALTRLRAWRQDPRGRRLPARSRPTTSSSPTSTPRSSAARPPRTRSRPSMRPRTAWSPPRWPRSCGPASSRPIAGPPRTRSSTPPPAAKSCACRSATTRVWLAARYARESDRFVRASSMAAASGVMPPAAAS